MECRRHRSSNSDSTIGPFVGDGHVGDQNASCGVQRARSRRLFRALGFFPYDMAVRSVTLLEAVAPTSRPMEGTLQDRRIHALIGELVQVICQVWPGDAPCGRVARIRMHVTLSMANVSTSPWVGQLVDCATACLPRSRSKRVPGHDLVTRVRQPVIRTLQAREAPYVNCASTRVTDVRSRPGLFDSHMCLA